MRSRPVYLCLSLAACTSGALGVPEDGTEPASPVATEAPAITSCDTPERPGEAGRWLGSVTITADRVAPNELRIDDVDTAFFEDAAHLAPECEMVDSDASCYRVECGPSPKLKRISLGTLHIEPEGLAATQVAAGGDAGYDFYRPPSGSQLFSGGKPTRISAPGTSSASGFEATVLGPGRALGVSLTSELAKAARDGVELSWTPSGPGHVEIGMQSQDAKRFVVCTAPLATGSLHVAASMVAALGEAPIRASLFSVCATRAQAGDRAVSVQLFDHAQPDVVTLQ